MVLKFYLRYYSLLVNVELWMIFKILHCYLNLTLQVGYAPRNKTLVQVPWKIDETIIKQNIPTKSEIITKSTIINYLLANISCWWDQVVLRSEAADSETSGFVCSWPLIPWKKICFNSIAFKILKHYMPQQHKLTVEVSFIHSGNLFERRLIYCSIATSGFMFPSFCQAFLAQRNQYCRSLIKSSSQPCCYN